MGIFWSNGGGASRKRDGAKVPSRHGCASSEDMVLHPSNSNSANIGSADVKVPELDTDNPSLMRDGKFRRTDLWVDLARKESEMAKPAPPTLDIVWESNQTYPDKLPKEKERSSGLTMSQESAVRLMNDMKLNFEAKNRHMDRQLQKDLVLIQQKDKALRDLQSAKDHLTSMITKFETKLRHNEGALLAKDRELQRLGSIIEEKDKDLAELQSSVYGSAAEVQKLRRQLAVVEKISAQESLTSGSYTEGCANPSLLVSAAQNVDEAMDFLTRFLYDNSLMRGTSLKASELASLIGAISPASPRSFTRPAHVKHVWGHWICVKMFQGFEHVYFDVSSDRTSPLDLVYHAWDCFRTYQEKKDVTSLEYFKECGFFREFCTKMFSCVFPAYLVDDARIEDSAKPRKSVSSGFGGGWEEPGELKRLFLDVAKAIWMLHELAFSFHPPASILRMGRGEPFDDEYQEAVTKDDDNNKRPMKVVLMLRPGFLVKKSVVKSRVFLAKSLTLNSQAST